MKSTSLEIGKTLTGHGPGSLLKVILPEQEDWTRESSEFPSNISKFVILPLCARHFRVPGLTPLFRLCVSSAFLPGLLPQ